MWNNSSNVQHKEKSTDYIWGHLWSGLYTRLELVTVEAYQFDQGMKIV